MTLCDYLADEAASLDFASNLALALKRQLQHEQRGLTIFLLGTLGAGKTTLCRGLLRSLGHSGAVKSPTYTLVEPYELEGVPAYHFDLYRLADAEELEYMGIRDYFEQNSLRLIEWPQRGEGILPSADLTVALDVQLPGRAVTIEATSASGEALLQKLQEQIAGT
ncbi:tRNA (adenosine(37)-N6)-threonylcarbamoyltransferase complex ATPase subunit type 1 TsaE [Agaribacterium haliotis]|uniref:tRNA (adenosine(37)-N6)-threonylcarbamoyltransferase complex ATPase subunit type 1 TsaE n=1 Tax=Agaribacterium haliotis TaxID=2013869 RepID=UPI000BB553D8|nr:tRNA (adenosine(37)-N6)-threonylcarbamoyltransferase complex ATPase subunit type 1 TsaE [Agaribacterium haliotis]